MITRILLFAAFCLPQMTFSQSEQIPPIVKGDVHLIAKRYEDRIVLRWGYDQPDIWFHALKQPVKLYRKNLTKGEKTYSLLKEILPLSETEMEQAAATSAVPDRMVVVLESIHRNWENTFAEGGEGLLEKWDNFNNRWSLVHYAADIDAQAAEIAGLRFVDNNIEKENRYAYKIEFEAFPVSKTDYRVVSEVIVTEAPKLYGTESLEGKVKIVWEKDFHEKRYSAFFVERSTKGKSWDKLNKVPYVQMFDESLRAGKFFTYLDSVGNENPYLYRIRGIDAFGDVSGPSNVLEGRGLDKTPPPAPELNVDSLPTHLTKALTWQQPEDSDHVTYHLEKKYGDQTYIINNWADPNQRAKVDTPMISGYYTYRLIVEDKNGNRAYSNPVLTKVYDLLPPSRPTGLTYGIDSMSRVVLSWDKPRENDVIGYFIYAGDGKKRHLTKLTNQAHRARIYIDEINPYQLTEKRWYALVAVDQDYQVSNFSDTLIIDRSDLIPPAPALIPDYQVKAEGIEFTLLPSASRDVVLHRLMRMDNDGGEWEEIAVFTEATPQFNDTTGLPGLSYTYQYLAEDNAGNVSKSVNDLVLTFKEEEFNVPLISIVRDGATATISWDNPLEDAALLIYKSKADQPFVLLARLGLKKLNFEDAIGKGHGIIKYRAKVISKDGISTRFSDSITLN